MLKPIDTLTLEDISSLEKRTELFSDNNYTFKKHFDIFNDVILPAKNTLARMKLYLIAEDTCFDFLGLKYLKEGNTPYILKPDGTKLTFDKYSSLIDTYRHAYISAIYSYKYGKTVARGIMDGKEFLDKTNSIRAHIKDFNNNAVGIDIGSNYKKIKDFFEASDKILNQIEKEYSNPKCFIKNENDKILKENLERINIAEWNIITTRSSEKGEKMLKEIASIVKDINPDYLKFLDNNPQGSEKPKGFVKKLFGKITGFLKKTKIPAYLKPLIKYYSLLK